MTLAAVDQPERLNAWQQATHPFLQHQTGFSRIATTLERIKRGEGAHIYSFFFEKSFFL
jgi:hypothetical protein